VTAALAARGVEKQFGGRTGTAALGPVDLSFAHGEVVALVGPSGCGKSTLLRVLAGLLPPTAGSVVGAGSASLSMVFQDANLLPWLTVEQNVALPLKVGGTSRARRRDVARDLCRLVGIEGFERHWPAQLSVGMRQRAALARSLAAEPAVLLLDEPFAALDALTRDEMNVELQRIWLERPTTVVLVTHSVAEAVLLADRVVVLSGRPATVVGEVQVDLARPRDLRLQHEPAFQALVRRTHELLRAAA
jgi:NitT/TauT family transport system ATP-binding protein